MPKSIDPAFAERVQKQITRQLVDSKTLIRAGFVLYVDQVFGKQELSAVQLAEMRNCFFAGAQHVFGSIITMLDEGSEETEDDMRRMDAIKEELQAFVAELRTKQGG